VQIMRSNTASKRVEEIVQLDDFLEQESIKIVQSIIEKKDQVWLISQAAQNVKMEFIANKQCTDRTGEVEESPVTNVEWNSRISSRYQLINDKPIHVDNSLWGGSHKPSERCKAILEYFYKLQEECGEKQVTLLHVWRELGLAFESRNNAFSLLPRLAAQYITDGFPFELLDGDAGYPNKVWNAAVLDNLAILMNEKKLRGGSRVLS